MTLKSAFPEIVLASASPRRRELLKRLGWEATIAPAEVDETPREQEEPRALALRLAQSKAEAAARQTGAPAVVLAADTIVVDGNEVLGKPADPAEARDMLLALRGREHEVITGVAILDLRSGRRMVEACSTRVPMRAYTLEEVAEYVATGSPLDKAGAYGIQDLAFQPVDLQRIDGCFTNVMGLPLCRVIRGMRGLGLEPALDAAADCPPNPGVNACRAPERLGLAG